MTKTGAADATGKPTAWMVAALLVTHGVAKINNSLKKLFTGFSFWLGPGVGVSPTGTVICYVVSPAFLAFSVLHRMALPFPPALTAQGIAQSQLFITALQMAHDLIHIPGLQQGLSNGSRFRSHEIFGLAQVEFVSCAVVSRLSKDCSAA